MATDQVSDPSPDDLTWLSRAEAHLLQLLQSKYGDVSFDSTEADLRLCQRLIDDKNVKKRQALEPQCIGVVLGNVITHHTPKKWQRVKNEFGDMLAVRDPVTGFTLYPLTMISKRLEDGRVVDLLGLYRDLAEIK